MSHPARRSVAVLLLGGIVLVLGARATHIAAPGAGAPSAARPQPSAPAQRPATAYALTGPPAPAPAPATQAVSAPGQQTAAPAAPSPTSPPTPVPTAGPLVPDSAGTTGAIVQDRWASVNTPGGCLKIRLSFERSSQQIDCLAYHTLVFVDGVQKVDGDTVVHLAGRGYTFPSGLTPASDPAETIVPFDNRPYNLPEIAYTTVQGDLWIVRGDGANPQRLLSGDQNLAAGYAALAWSPNGARLLARRDLGDGGDVQVYDAQRGLRTVFPAQPGDAGTTGVAAWSADSGHLLVASYDSPGNACQGPANGFTLNSVDVESGTATPLYRALQPGYVAGVAASPDGRSAALLFGASCDAKSFNLCLLALQDDPAHGIGAGALRCPSITAGTVAWSPDGQYLAYTKRVQSRDDESALPAGQPLGILQSRTGAFYPLAYPLRRDSNIIGVAWEPDSRTLQIEDEVPRGLADFELPDRVIRRITVDGSRRPVVEASDDPLLSVRPVLAPGQVQSDYALAAGANGELWVLHVGGPDARWQLTPDAAPLAAWSS